MYWILGVNGKMRTKLTLSVELTKDQIQEAALQDEIVQKWLEGNTPKKVIIVPKKIINLVM